MINILSRFYEILCNQEEEYHPWLFLTAGCMVGGAFAYYKLTTSRNALISLDNSLDLEANRHRSESNGAQDTIRCDSGSTQPATPITRPTLVLLEAFSKLSRRKQKFMYRMCQLQPMFLAIMEPNSDMTKWILENESHNSYLTELTLKLLSCGLRNPAKMYLYKEGIRLLPNLNLIEFMEDNTEIYEELKYNLSDLERIYADYKQHITTRSDPTLVNTPKMHAD